MGNWKIVNETRAKLAEDECSHHYDSRAPSLTGVKHRLFTHCYYLPADIQ